MRFPLVRYLSLAALIFGSSLLRAERMAWESFEGYPAGRLRVSSRGAWESSTQAQVAVDAGQAKEGEHYLEIKTNSGTQKAERVFTGIPDTGVIWLDLYVYNGFTPESLQGSQTNPSIRLGNENDYFLGLIFRPRQTQIEIMTKEQGDVPARFFPTGVLFTKPAWRRITFRLDYSDHRAEVYIDGAKCLSGLSFGEAAGGLSKLDIRGSFPMETDSLRVDGIGFYNENPLEK